MERKKVFWRIVMVFSAIWFISLLPIPGVDSSENINISDEEIKVSMIKESSIEVVNKDWNALGEYNIVNQEITLATDYLPLFQFFSTCSHEIKHVNFHGKSMTTEEEHDRINQIGGWIMPWDWEKNCLQLLDNRLNLS